MKALIVTKEFLGRSIGSIERVGQASDIDALNGNFYDSSMIKMDIPDGVDPKYLLSALIATALEKWTKDGESDSATQPELATDMWYNGTDLSASRPTVAQDMWIKEGEDDLLSAPLHFNFIFHAAGTTDERDSSTFAVDTWVHLDGDPQYDFTEMPVDPTYTVLLTGAFDPRYYQMNSGDIDPSWSYVAEVPEHWELSEDTTAKILADKTAQVASAYNVMQAEVLTQMSIVFGTSNPDSASAYERTWNLMSTVPSDWSGAGLTSRFNVGAFAIDDALDTDQKILDYASAKISEVHAYGIWRMQRIETFRTDKAAIEAA